MGPAHPRHPHPAAARRAAHRPDGGRAGASARDGGVGADGDLEFCAQCEMPLLDHAAFCDACGTAVRVQAKPTRPSGRVAGTRPWGARARRPPVRRRGATAALARGPVGRGVDRGPPRTSTRGRDPEPVTTTRRAGHEPEPGPWGPRAATHRRAAAATAPARLPAASSPARAPAGQGYQPQPGYGPQGAYAAAGGYPPQGRPGPATRPAGSAAAARLAAAPARPGRRRRRKKSPG